MSIIGLVSCGEQPVEPTPADPTPVDPQPKDPTPVVCTHDYIYISDGAETHHQECSKCKEKLASEPHVWDAGVKGNGVMLYTCDLCGQTKSVELKVYAANGFYNFSSLPVGDITSRQKFADGIYFNGNNSYKLTVDENSKTFTNHSGAEIEASKRVKFNGATQSGAARTIEIEMEKAGRIFVYSLTSSSSDLARQIAIWNKASETNSKGDALMVSADYEQGKLVETKELHVLKEGTYYIGATSNASNIYAIEIIYDTCEHELSSSVAGNSTCGQKGSTKYHCGKCGIDVTLNDIERSAHNFSTTYQHANGFHWFECSVCHEIQEGSKVACTADPAKHVEGATPTEDNPETKNYDTCTICGGEWVSEVKRWTNEEAKSVVIANPADFTDTEQRTEFKISDHCKYLFSSANQLKVQADAAGVNGFKMDKADDVNFPADNSATFVNKYFVLTGLNEGDEVVVSVNSGGSSRGIRFGKDSSLMHEVAKTSNPADIAQIKHIVTKDEATNGVKFCAYGGTMFVSKIVWNKK